MTYVYGSDSLDYPKSDLVPLGGGDDPTKYLSAASYNDLCTFIDEIRDAIRDGKLHGLSAEASLPVVSGASQFFWYNATNILNFYANGKNKNVPLNFGKLVTTSSYSLNIDDTFLYVNYAGSVALTLPTGIDNHLVYIKDASGLAGTNNITISGTGGQLIDGSASKLIDINYGSISLYFYNNRWSVISAGNTTSGITQAYQTVESNSTPLTQRSTLNVLPRLTVADSGSKTTLDLTSGIATPGSVAFGNGSVTVDTYGRVTSYTSASNLITQAYQTVEGNGTPVTQRSTLNVLPRLTVADSGGKTTLDLTSGVATPGSASFGNGSVTVDTYGRVTSYTSASNLVTQAYQTVENSGSAVTQRSTINLQPRIVATDSGGKTSIDLETIGGLTPGSFTNTNITVDAYGRVTAASNGSGGSTSLATAYTNFGTGPVAIVYNATQDYVTWQRNGNTTTTTNIMMAFENTTASTGGAQTQNSPMVVWIGHGWNASADRYLTAGFSLRPNVVNSGNIQPELVFQTSVSATSTPSFTERARLGFDNANSFSYLYLNNTTHGISVDGSGSLNLMSSGTKIFQITATALVPATNAGFDIGSSSLFVKDIYTRRITGRAVTLSGTTPTIDFSTSYGNNYDNISANVTSVTLNANGTQAQRGHFTLSQDGTGGRTFAFPTTNIQWGYGNTAPVLSTHPDARDSFFVAWDASDSVWVELGRTQFAKGRQYARTSTQAGSETIDSARAEIYKINMTGDITTLTIANGSINHARLVLIFKQDGTGSWVVTNTSGTVKFAAGASTFTLTSGSANVSDVYELLWDNDGSRWIVHSATLNINA